MKEPNAFSTYDAETQTFKAAEDPSWKSSCYERFPWVKRLTENGFKKVYPSQIASLSDKHNISAFESADSLKQILNDEVHGKFHVAFIKNATLYEEYPANTFTWRHLFHKLCFE